MNRFHTLFFAIPFKRFHERLYNFPYNPDSGEGPAHNNCIAGGTALKIDFMENAFQICLIIERDSQSKCIEFVFLLMLQC